jgi:hypothetical protein
MNREIIIAKYINAVENILVAFHLNIEPEKEDIRTVTLKTKEFTNALRELYLSNDKNKDDKYKVIFDVISKASFRIVKENFEINPMGTYWAVIIYNLEIAYSHISELHCKETHYYYPFPKDDLPPQQTETETAQETPTFTNNFDNIIPTEIYKHFKAGLVEKGYLTEQELNEYLKAAFELKTKPETLFKLKHTPTKQKIYTVFYIYYKDVSQKKHERQKEYAALLGDFFEGYKTEIIQTNWARDYKTKR